MKLPKFILNRTDDYLRLSRWRMIGVALLYYFCFFVVNVVLMMICIFAYNACGIAPESLTDFWGNPMYRLEQQGLQKLLLTTLLIAPLCEELIFRLGISMKRKMVTLWAGLAPAVSVWYLVSKEFMPVALSLEFGLLMAAAVWFLTDDEMWEKARVRYFRPVVWISAVAFGLLHLNAVTDISWQVLPYALCLCLMPFFGGCIFTYFRMNMGFFAGLAAHVLFNLPGVGTVLMSLQ